MKSAVRVVWFFLALFAFSQLVFAGSGRVTDKLKFRPIFEANKGAAEDQNKSLPGQTKSTKSGDKVEKAGSVAMDRELTSASRLSIWIPAAGMAFALVVALFIFWRKKREYDTELEEEIW